MTFHFKVIHYHLKITRVVELGKQTGEFYISAGRLHCSLSQPKSKYSVLWIKMLLLMNYSELSCA